MRQKGDLGWQAEPAHLVGRHQRDAGELLGIRVFVDMGVGDEQGAFVQHQGIERGQSGRAFLHADHIANMVQVTIKTADDAAQHRIGITELDHQRGDCGVGAAHCRLGRFDRDATPAHETMIGLPVLAKARVVFRVDVFHIDAKLQTQARLGQARLDHGRAPDQDRLREVFVHHDLHCTQHPFVLALGIGNALGTGRDRLGRGEHGTHEHAGLVDETRELLAVGVHVVDRTRGDARVGCGLSYGRRDAHDQARIEGRGDQVVRSEHQFLAGIGVGHLFADVGLGQVGNLAHAGQLHLLGDLGCAAVERATEDVGETQDVVDLVRVVRATGGDDAVGPGL